MPRMAETGVLTLAYGRPQDAAQACALARSIRLRSRGVPLAVATDLPAELFCGLFDRVIPWRFGRWPGPACKLELLDITPFDTTLYIDSDCLCVRRIEPVLDYFGGAEFAVYGANSPVLPWADGTEQFRNHVDAANFPVFNGGLYHFRQGALAQRIFASAQHFSTHFADLGLPRPKGMHNDELLFSLALAQAGVRAHDSTDLVVMVAPRPPACWLELDLLRGHGRLERHGVILEPELVHFNGPRKRLAAYRREQLVLEHIVGHHWPAATRPMLAALAAADAGLNRARVALAQWRHGQR